jgi:hypothetical protein
VADAKQDTLHETSMAVWDERTPIVVGNSMKVQVGVACAEGCRLSGRFVEVLDDKGQIVAEGRLGTAPLAGTERLYWAELTLKAPATAGVASFSARFVDTVAELGHESASVRFSCRVTPVPEHKVSITVIDKHTGIGERDVEVRLGLYIHRTDRRGTVRVDVPGGTYDLSIRKDGFGAAPTTVDVSGDTVVRVEGMSGPTMAEIAPRLTAFEGFPWG